MKKIIILLLTVLCASGLYAQNKKKIAIYVISDNAGISKVVGGKMVGEITKSGKYVAVERTAEFLAELQKEQVYQRTGNVDDNEISKLGKQFGVDLVCVAEMVEVLGSNYLSARLIDVETASVIATADGHNDLDNIDELIFTTEDVACRLLGGKKKIKQDSKKTVNSKKNKATKGEKVVVEPSQTKSKDDLSIKYFDNNVELSFTSCNVVGNNVVIEFLAVNTSDEVYRLRLSSAIALDNLGNEYKINLRLGNDYNNSAGSVSNDLPAGVPMKLILTVLDVKTKATKLPIVTIKSSNQPIFEIRNVQITR